MSAVYVDSIKDKSNTKTLATLSSSAVNLHSDVVFPYDGTTDAGRIIQVKHLYSKEANTLDDSWTVRWNYSLTLKSGDSRVMVLHTENTYVASGVGYGVKVYRNTSVYNDSVTSITGTAVYPYIPLNASGKSHMVHSGSGSLYSINPINYMDDVSSSFNAGDTVYYGHYYQRYTNLGVQVPAEGNGTDHGAFITIIMELEK